MKPNYNPSELEEMIIQEMINKGLNPYNPADIVLFWEERLN